jgi:Flp pilus assembly protein TadG
MNTTTRFNVKHKTTSQRRGVAAVEMAFVLPLFMMLIFGIVEFGRGMMCMQVLTNSAREGARACAVSPLNAAEVETICQEYAEGCGIAGVTVSVTPDPTTVIRGEPVTVSVSINYADVALIPPFYMKDGTLTSQSVMRKEREYD